MQPKKLKTRPVHFKEIPCNLLDCWKAWCALHGVSMRQDFLEYIRRRIQEREPVREKEKP